MIACPNPDCGLTVVDTDSMYREKPIQVKNDYNSQMTCKVCGSILEATNSL